MRLKLVRIDLKARLRADQTKYHQNLTEIAQQHVKDLDRLRAELADDSPGTPLGRLNAIGEFAVGLGLCTGTEAKPSELFVLEALVVARAELASLRAELAGQQELASGALERCRELADKAGVASPAMIVRLRAELAAVRKAHEETAENLNGFILAHAAARQDAERVRHPWRAVDNQDWDFLFSKIGWGGRERFWRLVLEETRTALQGATAVQKGHPRYGGRPKGTRNRFCGDLREAVVAGIAAVGFTEKDEDGKPKRGQGGVQGFIEWLAMYEPKTAAALFARVLPYFINVGMEVVVSSVLLLQLCCLRGRKPTRLCMARPVNLFSVKRSR
jgi:hypothetical protein